MEAARSSWDSTGMGAGEADSHLWPRPAPTPGADAQPALYLLLRLDILLGWRLVHLTLELWHLGECIMAGRGLPGGDPERTGLSASLVWRSQALSPAREVPQQLSPWHLGPSAHCAVLSGSTVS